MSINIPDSKDKVTIAFLVSMRYNLDRFEAEGKRQRAEVRLYLTHLRNAIYRLHNLRIAP